MSLASLPSIIPERGTKASVARGTKALDCQERVPSYMYGPLPTSEERFYSPRLAESLNDFHISLYTLFLLLDSI